MHEREQRENQPSEPEIESTAEVEPVHRPRIYAASLSDYNNGILHGDWLDAAVEPAELHETIGTMLRRSPTTKRLGQRAEEWAIHDYEGFGPLRLGEYESVEWITEVAKGIALHGEAFAAWAAHIGSDRSDLERFDDVYAGQWDSVDDYAEEFLNDLGATQAIEQLDDWLQPYVKLNIEGFARDLVYGGDIIVVERPTGGVWIFSSW